MGKENLYPGLIPISPDLKRAIAAVIGVPCAITPFLIGCQRYETAIVEPITTPMLQLVPTYTPTPKIEVTPTPEPTKSPIPEKISQEISDSKTEIIPSEQPAERETVKYEIQPREKIEVFRDLSQQYSEIWRELPSRAGNAMAYVERVNQVGLDFSAQETKSIEFSNFSAYHDFKIFEKYGIGERDLALTKENLLFVLAWYELEYAQPIEQNPNFQRAIKELIPAIKVVNEIIEDKISAKEFIGKKTPQIPKNLQGRLLFGNDNRGGRFFPEIYVIEEMKNPNPEKYQHLLEYFAGVVPHELIHAWPQALFVGQGASWDHEIDYETDYQIKKGDTLWHIAQENGLRVEDILKVNPQIEDPNFILAGESIKISQEGKLIWPQNRKYHLAHMSMCSLTAPAQEKLGFEPGIEPRIIYIYSRLKENGVEDPYGLIVQAGAKMRGEDLWQVYESVRKEGDLSLDELIATNDPDSDFSYYTSEELEAFRAEYAPYLSQK